MKNWLKKIGGAVAKKCAKWVCPSASTLAGYAADGIANAFNKSTDDIRVKVATYSSYAQEATRIANTLSRMLADGQIDPTETAAVKKVLTPLFEKALALV